MKPLFTAMLLLAGLLFAARAQASSDDQYIAIYGLIQQADQFYNTGDSSQALAAYDDAQTQLRQFQQQYPDWNPNIISYRLKHLAEKIANLKASVPTIVPAAATPSSAAPVVAAATNVTVSSAQLDGLRSQLQAAQAANQTLLAKLKEALAAQPDSMNPDELKRAQAKIIWLMKENALLKSGGAGGPTNSTQTVTNYVKVVVTNTITQVVTNQVSVGDTNALAMMRLNYATAVSNFNAEHARAERLADELEKMRKAPPSGNTNTVVSSKLQAAATEQKLAAATNSAASLAATEARVRELTQERDDLIEKMDLLTKQKAGGKNADLVAQISTLNAEVTQLRSRLAVVEASPVPYSAGELALLKSSAPKPASSNDGKSSINEMPAGTAELVATAQQHFARGEYSQAEADYQKILDHDQNNAIALANLATIEMQENKLAAAAKHINAALAQNPDDAYNLTTLGYLQFRQGKYDDALNTLSRAAQIDPNNPEIQNYLGVTLSHQGQRKAAETALRRAIQIDPNYAPAHNNLAVIYLSEDPPMPEMARWHYEKALAAGQPRNPDLEKMLAAKGAPVPSQP